MKGIVFQLLEEAVTEQFGADTWESLLDAAALDGAYTSLGNYPDAQLFGLVGAASAALKKPAPDIVRWFGNACIPKFAERYPALFQSHKDSKSLILSLNQIIHPEVRKLYPGADVPDFDFKERGPKGLSLGYHSKRKLCAFAEGLIEGTAHHFGETVTLSQSLCMLRGEAKCVIECDFGGGSKATA